MTDFAFRHFQGERGAQRMQDAHDALTREGWSRVASRGDRHRYEHPDRPGEKVMLSPSHAETATVSHYKSKKGGWSNSGFVGMNKNSPDEVVKDVTKK